MAAAGRYEQLTAARSPFLKRARECAKLTIPSLLPEEGHTGSANLPTPFQGMGARGVNNLASKLLLALLPPSIPFFRLPLDDYTLEQLSGGDKTRRADAEEVLGTIERTTMAVVEDGLRTPTFEALKQLLISGNVLIYLPPEGGMKTYRLDRYVVKRDPMGNVLEIVIKESVFPSALPPDFVEKMKGHLKDAAQGSDTLKTVDIYTYAVRDGDYLNVHQEVKDQVIPGTSGRIPVDKAPFIALRWSTIDGEDYGRGHVEEYLGDLRSLEGLMQAIVEGAAASAKMLWLVDPNGTTRAKDIAEAPNLAVRTGNADEVTVVQADKYGDFRVAQEVAQQLTLRLAQAFLLMDSVRRDAERVTAEEIRQMAGELEDALGGVYSLLSQEFQLPLVRRLLHVLEKQGRIPALPEGLIKPTIVTGLSALGRGHDLNQLLTFGRILTESLGPEVTATYLNKTDFIKRVGTALAIDMDGLVRSEDEVAQQQARAQRQALLEKLGPDAMKAAAQRQAQQQPQQQ